MVAPALTDVVNMVYYFGRGETAAFHQKDQGSVRFSGY